MKAFCLPPSQSIDCLISHGAIEIKHKNKAKEKNKNDDNDDDDN